MSQTFSFLKQNDDKKYNFENVTAARFFFYILLDTVFTNIDGNHGTVFLFITSRRLGTRENKKACTGIIIDIALALYIWVVVLEHELFNQGLITNRTEKS